MIDERTAPGDRRTRRRLLALAAGVGLAFSGCLELDVLADDGARDDPGGTSDGAVDEAATDWRSESLVDTTTDESFAIDEFDRPVLVHTYAIWCGTCRRQHREFASLLEDRSEALVVVDLNVDPNEDAAAVRENAAAHGFDWTFAVSPPHVTEALVDEFGSSITSPPRSPVVLVCPDGETHVLGKVVTASDLAESIEDRCG